MNSLSIIQRVIVYALSFIIMFYGTPLLYRTAFHQPFCAVNLSLPICSPAVTFLSFFAAFHPFGHQPTFLETAMDISDGLVQLTGWVIVYYLSVQVLRLLFSTFKLPHKK
jgi:hypothetical protein